MPRLYRETPLNSIWEGSGNVNALDVLRALGSSSAALDAYLAEVDAAAGADPRLDAFAARLKDEARDPTESDGRARLLVERLAMALQGSLLVRHAPPEVADAFCATRLAGEGGRAYGSLPAGIDTGTIVDRHRPALG